MEINVPELLISLNWMWKGMLLLFICCGFIALLTMLVNKIMKQKK